MYEAADDPYCYPGTGILKNRLNLRKQADLDAFEAEITAQRAAEPLPAGSLATRIIGRFIGTCSRTSIPGLGRFAR
jgi:hypothetical protein